MNLKSFCALLILLFFVFGCKNLSDGIKKQSHSVQSRTVFRINVFGGESGSPAPTDQAAQVIEKRLNLIGADFEVKKIADDEIELTVYSDDPEKLVRIQKLAASESRFELCEVVSPPGAANFRSFPTRKDAENSLGESPINNDKAIPVSRKIFESEVSGADWIIIKKPCIIEGADLHQAETVSSVTNHYSVSFTLTPEGGQKINEWTSKNIGNYLAITINDKANTVAIIRAPINEQGEISGNFSKTDAEDLAALLNGGYFAAKMQFVQENFYPGIDYPGTAK